MPISESTVIRNIALLTHSLPGVGKALLMAEKISSQLTDANTRHRIFKGDWPAQFAEFTEIFIVGGDGTLNYFINQYPGITLPLAIFNGGTGNDFHWLLYGNKSLTEQLNIVLSQNPKPIDIGKCNGRYFINGAGIGFSGAVAMALSGKNKTSGKSAYFITILKKIFTYRSRFYTLIAGERIINGKKLFIDISNGQRAGGGIHIAPESSADDGLFDIIIADAINAFERLKYLPVIEKGKHLKAPVIQHFRTNKISIEGNKPIQFHLDGEYYSAQKLDIELLPAALNFLY
jgi:YegS/Rv2252/BmrU family lipid kinase